MGARANGCGSRSSGQPGLDVQPCRRTDHSELAAAHAELPLIDGSGRLDLESLTDPPNRRRELDRDDVPSRLEVADDMEQLVCHVMDAGRSEANLGVLGDMKEVARAQVPVARSISG